MVNRKALVLSFAGIGILSGCAAPQPVPKDPFANLFDSAPAAYPNLKVAVILSDNTKNSFDSGQKNSWYPGVGELAQSMLDRNAEMIKKNFQSAVRVEKLSDAARTNADLVVVMDLLVQYIRTEYVQNSLIFVTPDGRTVETLKTDGRKSYFGCLNPINCLRAAADEAREKLAQALHASTALAEFARTKAGAGAAAEAPAKVYHSDVDNPLYAGDPRPDDFALVIGVEKYQSIPPAEFAERDAASVRAHLLALGYPEGNIIYLTGPKASRTGIEKYVETWLPLNVKENSRLFVYFSGHGAPDPGTSQAYLVPWDGDPKFLKDSGYPIKHLYERLNSLKARQIVLTMDACFSGEGGRSVLAKGARPLVTQVDTALPGPGKLVVFSASAANEITAGEDAQGHGLFTYYFLKGLNEKGGKTTLRGLYDFLLPHVQDGAHRDGREQTPQLMTPDAASEASASF
ncbi:MAG: caspase domain-containing protein [Elusimicrobiota bacterium]